MVVPPPDPTITLTGGGHIARSATDIAAKSATVRLFDDLSCMTKVDEGEFGDITNLVSVTSLSPVDLI